jgi:hypothetical protein
MLNLLLLLVEMSSRYEIALKGRVEEEEALQTPGPGWQLSAALLWLCGGIT